MRTKSSVEQQPHKGKENLACLHSTATYHNQPRTVEKLKDELATSSLTTAHRAV